MILLIERIAFWAMLPFVAAQGLWVRRRAPRFADAAGPRSGRSGEGRTIRLLALGDSIVAGVGAATLDEALVGRFVEALGRRTLRRIEWQSVGRTGARSKQIRNELIDEIAATPFDIILVSVGVNDVTGLVRSRTWTGELDALLERLRAHSPGATILMAGLPPLWGFPLLPQPLRYVFGLRARTFDRFLQQVAVSRERCFYVPTAFEPSPEKFADDGYHPSVDSYRVWGEELADWVLTNELLTADLPNTFSGD